MSMIIDTFSAGEDIIFRNAPVLVIAHAPSNLSISMTSCTIALTTMELAAKGYGLGTCWAGLLMMAVADRFEPVINRLNLPLNQWCYGAMMMGYPAFSYQRIPARKKPDVTFSSS